VPPEEGFGQRKQELIGTVKKSSFPDHIAPTVGQQVQLQLPNGKNLNVSVADIEDEIVTLDGNHPLAGHTLKFDVEMIDII
jgi:FKBP-type peptidyl-prolyl cis-trans isomerase 2